MVHDRLSVLLWCSSFLPAHSRPPHPPHTHHALSNNRLHTPSHLTPLQTHTPSHQKLPHLALSNNRLYPPPQPTAPHNRASGINKQLSERVGRDEEAVSNRRVKFEPSVSTKSISKVHSYSESNSKVHSYSDRSQKTPFNGESSNVKVLNNNIHKLRSHLSQSVEELDRSSPSGQSQSDYSEHYLYGNKHNRTKAKDSSISSSFKEKTWKSIEDLYSYPTRKKKEVEKDPKLDAKIISNNKNNVKKAVTYYHYPRPDPLTPVTDHHLTDHLLSMGHGHMGTGGVLAPPEGFEDSGSSDSEGSDSGLSGVSGGHLHNGSQHNADNTSTNGQEQVTEEQFRSWEYLLARNTKMLFMRELDTLQRSNSSCSIMPTVSAPDLVLATENESTTPHFQRNVVRKSRLGSGTFRLIQTKLSATTSKFSTLQKLRRSNSKTSKFHRFGSLQNLKYYQENRPRPPHYQLVEPDLSMEMQEKNAVESLELETRMHQYWHQGVTNF